MTDSCLEIGLSYYSLAMGCAFSRPKDIEKVNDIDNFDDLNEVKDIPDADPRLPLNIRQVFKLKQSWKGIKRKSSEAGVEMFIRYVNVMVFCV